MKDRVEDMAEGAVPANMKFMMFKMWVVSKFSCCMGGSPEMSKMDLLDVPAGVPDVPEVNVVPDFKAPDVLDVPKIGL